MITFALHLSRNYQSLEDINISNCKQDLLHQIWQYCQQLSQIEMSKPAAVNRIASDPWEKHNHEQT